MAAELPNHDPVPDAWALVDPPQVSSADLLIPTSRIDRRLVNASQNAQDMGFNTIHLLPLTTLDTSQAPIPRKTSSALTPATSPRAYPRWPRPTRRVYRERQKPRSPSLCFDLVLNHVGTDSYIAKRRARLDHADPTSLTAFAVPGTGLEKTGNPGGMISSLSTTSIHHSKYNRISITI